MTRTMIAGEDITKGELVIVDEDCLTVFSAKKCRPGRHSFVHGLCIFCPVREGNEPGLDSVCTVERRLPTGVTQMNLEDHAHTTGESL